MASTFHHLQACSGVHLSQFAFEEFAAGVFGQAVGKDHALGRFE
jgi:hypothetical protein